MSKVIGQVVKEMTNIRNSMEKFQQVELLEQLMKVLKKSLYDANMLLHKEKNKVTKQQNVKDPESKKPRVRQPEAPLSPMIYSSVYAPLTKKSQSKDYHKKDSRSFNLEEKLNRLDLLEQDEAPTPVQYAPQGPSIQSSHNRNPWGSHYSEFI